MVLGHEPAGIIAKIGVGVTGWSAGDPVLIEPAIYCYHCEFCMSGHHNVCANLRFLSQPGEPGFLRDSVNIPATNLLGLPAGVSPTQGTLFEPLAVVLHSMKFVGLRPGETAAVFGGGPIGLLTIAVLKIAGASRIWCVEPMAHRRELALACGASVVLDPSSADPAREITSDTGNRGVDVAIDCAARGNTMNQCLRVTRNAGRVVITGIPSEVLIPLEFHVMRRKELAFYNVRRSNHESERALDLMRERLSLFAPVLTHVFSLERAQQAFETLEGYWDGVGKIVIVPATRA
jgi:threonine dehydrogenase-like Zn-dependent dehydrogenase